MTEMKRLQSEITKVRIIRFVFVVSISIEPPLPPLEPSYNDPNTEAE